MLDQSGCVIHAEKGVLKVVKGSILITKGIRINGLYVLSGNTTVGEASVIDSEGNRSKL